MSDNPLPQAPAPENVQHADAPAIHDGIAPPSASDPEQDLAEREAAQRAMDKLVARVKVAELTRMLRARLALVGFKVHHNLEALPIDALEREFATKFGADASGTASGSLKRRASGMSPALAQQVSSMGPPQSPSLYTSMLASPPPAKRARHAQPNALLPPPRVSPRGSTRAPARSPRNMPAQRASQRAVQKDSPHDANASTEPDAISAAATLTSLLLTSRSPRSNPVSRTSSIASSSQATAAATYPSSSQGTLLDDPLPLSPHKRTNTPPKRKAEENVEAAELMLFLATSPSPAQTHSKAATSKSLSGVGRVLFPTSKSTGTSNSAQSESKPPDASASRQEQSPPPASGSFSPARTPSHPSSSHALLTPKSASFNINDFINVSPSPSAPPPSSFFSSVNSGGYRPGMAATGRRLFEEETGSAASQRRTMFGDEPTSLAAGIDLVNAA
ncbi:hypothetical protein EXIGLDRAFT_502282 [Exidia glandulosa HHB12029]|uniref:Uncharacterized protein n=1 Tax=Exidia glandulosa HHB12029 TaxID=1314781 RepID=A0A165JEQ6_EXIGL|nr:hypothetical protein EXIGLDRAFT_502282 [Exidia glandulosa HHB12029]